MEVLTSLSSISTFVIIFIVTVTVHQPTSTAQTVGGCTIMDFISCWMPCMPCPHRPSAICRQVRRGCGCENVYTQNNRPVPCTPEVSAQEPVNPFRRPVNPVRVTTTTQQAPIQRIEVPACPAGVRRVQCMVDPCDVTDCPAVPSAMCRSDYCGGCFADFYQDGLRVNCQITQPTSEVNQVTNMVDRQASVPPTGPLDNTLHVRQLSATPQESAGRSRGRETTTEGPATSPRSGRTQPQTFPPTQARPNVPESRIRNRFFSGVGGRGSSDGAQNGRGRTATEVPTTTPRLVQTRPQTLPPTQPRPNLPESRVGNRFFSGIRGRGNSGGAQDGRTSTLPAGKTQDSSEGSGVNQQGATPASSRPQSGGPAFPSNPQQRQTSNSQQGGTGAPTPQPSSQSGQQRPSQLPSPSTSTRTPSRFFPSFRRERPTGPGSTLNVGAGSGALEAASGSSPNRPAGSQFSNPVAPQPTPTTTTTSGPTQRNWPQNTGSNSQPSPTSQRQPQAPSSGNSQPPTPTPRQRFGVGSFLSRGNLGSRPSNADRRLDADSDNPLPGSFTGLADRTTAPPPTTTTTALSQITTNAISTASAAPCKRRARQVTCDEDPCQSQTCNIPSARCRPSGCGSCHAEWYVGDRVVQCQDDCSQRRLSNAWCPMNPCAMQSCDRFPGAVCRKSSCGSCRAEWYQGQQRVTDMCFSNVSVDICPTEQPLSCRCRRCPSYPSAACRIRGCGSSCRLEFVVTSGDQERVVPCHGMWQRT